MTTLKKYWPTIFHAIVVIAALAAPSVTAYVNSGAAHAAIAAALWAELNHWLQSPNSNSGSRF